MGGRGVERHDILNSDEQFCLMRLLLTASLPNLNGKKFEQKSLDDGFNETLTAELNDGRKFTVSNYGDQAPPAYFAITRYLDELKTQKFNDQ